MNLQPASQKEIKRIAVGTLFCDGIMAAGLFLLSQFDIGTFEPVRILLSALGGSAIAILNFTIMCLTVQSAVGMTDKKKMRSKFQLSYNARMVLQSGWIAATFLIPQIHFAAGAAPVLFPKITILFLQSTGKLLSPDPSGNSVAGAADISEPAAGSADSEA